MPEATVVRLPDQSRVEIHLGGACVGVAHYRRSGSIIDIEHVIVEPAFEGRGLAGQLVAAMFDDAREHGDRIIPTCSYAAAWARRHPDQIDLLDS